MVQFYEGAGFRQPHAERAQTQMQRISDDPLYEPLKNIGVDEAGIRRIFKQHARGLIQRWIRITDTGMHEHPRGFPGIKTSSAAFLMDAIGHNRMPPDWIHAHEKDRQRAEWDQHRQELAAEEQVLREQYQARRTAALQEFLASPTGRHQFDAMHSIYLEFYCTVEPHRYREAAKEAAMNKMEREHFQFPDFSVWLLSQHVA